MKNEMNYVQLLRLAEATTSRKEAIKLINLADKVRNNQLQMESMDYPVVYGN